MEKDCIETWNSRNSLPVYCGSRVRPSMSLSGQEVSSLRSSTWAYGAQFLYTSWLCELLLEGHANSLSDVSCANYLHPWQAWLMHPTIATASLWTMLPFIYAPLIPPRCMAMTGEILGPSRNRRLRSPMLSLTSKFFMIMKLHLRGREEYLMISGPQEVLSSVVGGSVQRLRRATKVNSLP